MSDEETKTLVEAVDINDPSLPVEDLDVDVEADQFATLPTVPEGTYTVKLHQKNPQQDVDSLWVKAVAKKSGEVYYKTGIEARISDPASKYDDWPVFDNMVTTTVQKSTGTNRIVGILKAGGQQIHSRSNVELMRQLQDYLFGNPTVKVVVKWEAFCTECKKSIKGEKRFPADRNGGHLNTIECPRDGSDLSAQARIDKYLPVD